MRATTFARHAGVALAAASFWLAPPTALAAATTIFAAAVGNVSDSTGDSLGDEGAAASSVFISAGVHAAGGPGNNGTSRMQMEFDISSLGTGPLVSAAIHLNTEDNEAFSPIDTTFFAATVDGNGTIEAADFQTAAVAIPGAVMSHSGTGTFNFDVTSEVNAALAAGRHWFVVQGRVDETLGPSYERGLQVESNSGPVPAGEHPRLLIVTDAVTPPAGPATPVPALDHAPLASLALLVGALGVALSRRKSRGIAS